MASPYHHPMRDEDHIDPVILARVMPDPRISCICRAVRTGAAVPTCASSLASASLGVLSACDKCCATASSADRRSSNAIATSSTCE